MLGLRVERAGAGERERFALRFERPLVGPQQGVGARHRRVQLHQVAVRGSLPIADVFARKLNVEILGRQLDPERRHRRAGHEVIDHAAAVGDAFADGKQVEGIGLDCLRQSLHTQRRLPGRFVQPERRLNARHFAGKKGGGDFRQGLRAFGRQAKTRGRRYTHVPAHRFRPGDFDPRQRPARRAERLITFESELDDLAAGHGLAVHQPQLGVGLVLWLADEVITHARRVEPRDGVALRHVKHQLAQGRLADVQLNLRVNRQLVVAEVIGQHLRHRQFGQDLVGLNPQREVCPGKPVSKPLAATGAKQRPGGVAFGKLVGRNLRQPARLHDFEPHRAVIDDADVAGKPRRAFWPQLHRIRSLWERAQRRLHLHLEPERVFLRLVETDDETAVGGIRRGFDAPGEDLVALHSRDFTRATHE